MAPEISSVSSFYVSAPTSPGHLFDHDNNIGVVSFYSVPASPTKITNMFNEAYRHDFDSNPTTTTVSPYNSDHCNDDSNFTLDDFEFETSRRYNVDEFNLSVDEYVNGNELHDQQHRESLPAMAFADELFCDGKVMPLKPPPRLHCANEESFVSHRTGPSSPTSMLRIPFTKRNLWNDDFDPFMVALENVKEDKRGTHRRAKSMFTTFPACMSQQTFKDVSNNDKNECRKKYYSMPNPGNHLERSPWNQNGNTEQKTPLKLAEPKGVVFARRARLVKMVNELPKKSSGSPFPELMVEARQGQFVGVRWGGQSIKRKNIKNFLFKIKNHYKEGEETWETKRPKIARKLSLMKSKVFVDNGKVEGKRVDDELEVKVGRKMRSKSMNMVKYRLLCMGVGAKYVE